MYKVFLEIFAALLTVGGTGMINYIIAEQLDAIDTTQSGSNREKAIGLVFTMFDYFLYLLMKFLWGLCLKGTPALIVTCVSTAVISLVISFTFSKWINKKFYNLINFVRGKNGMSFRRSATNWQSALKPNENHWQRVYLYDFSHNPLGFGWRIGVSNDTASNYSISFTPISNEGDQPPYEELIQNIQGEDVTKEYDILQYVNFQQKFIVVIANLKD